MPLVRTASEGYVPADLDGETGSRCADLGRLRPSHCRVAPAPAPPVLAMAFKLIESAQTRRQALNAPHLHRPLHRLDREPVVFTAEGRAVRSTVVRTGECGPPANVPVRAASGPPSAPRNCRSII
jgi:hypothetical protein